MNIGWPEQALRKAEWQDILFAETIQRPALQNLNSDWELRKFKLRVHRNQPFEFVASVLTPFLAYTNLESDIAYSDYDDSLSFPERGIADIEMFWLDYERYLEQLSPRDLAKWLKGRLLELRTFSTAPILLVNSIESAELNEKLNELAGSIPGTRICDQMGISKALGESYFDLRAMKVTGMKLSNAACIATARAAGFTWIPEVLLPRIKAIVLDLDNTLYSGVLGEDGPQGVELTGAHRDLQAELLRLRENGIFLALASRNEIEDVERLFSDRKDFLLKKEHFSTTRISWEPKATGIASVISNLRIGADAVLFIDDNPGEIAATAAEIPGLKFLHASSAEATSRALKQYPGISGRKLEHADSLRVSDMAANELRAELLINSSDPIEYLTSLCAELTLSLNPEPFIRRISELSNKTNQFNTNFARLTEAEISRRLADPVSRIVSIALLDRLSDSGLIGMIAGRIQENELLIDDLCISCRALGRHLEDIMITEAISAMADDNKVETIAFAFKEGPRNRPAREWLAKYTGFSEIGDVVKIPWHPDTALNPIRSAPVKIRWE